MLDHFPILLAVGSETEDYVRDLLVILLAAAAVSIFTRRIRLPSIPGYLIVGALFGGSVFGFIKSDENVRQITDLAIVLLMFTIGLHLDTDSIRSGMVSILIVGVASTVGSALALWPLGMAFGLGWEQALAVGLGLSMSSTAVVLGILQQRREVHRIHGRLCVGIALTQDLLAIAFLLLIPVLAHSHRNGANIEAASDAAAIAHRIADTTVLQKLATVGKALLGVGALIGFGRWVMPRLLREASRDSNTEALLVVSAAGALAAAVITSVLGVGAALGAFLAGFLLSATPFRHQLAGQLSPMRDLFMAVFFTAVGIKVNIADALDAWWVVGLGVIALLAVKTAVIGFATWAGGATAPISGLTATLLSQGGEFSLVILGIAANEYGMFEDQATSVLIAVVVLSLILTTPVYMLGIRAQETLARVPLARWITNPALSGHHTRASHGPSNTHAPSESGADDPPLPYPHRPVIIAGFGVVGRNLVEHFAAAGIPYVVIELNPATVVKQQKLGRRFVFGDITNGDVLESAGIHAAEAIVLTIPDDEAVLRACRLIRQMNPRIFIAARTSYLSRAIAATELGADYVTVEEVVTAQDMAKQVMERLARRLVGET